MVQRRNRHCERPPEPGFARREAHATRGDSRIGKPSAGSADASPATASARRGLAGEPGVPPRSYPGHSALNLEAFALVTTPPFGSPASTSMPPQPLPVLTALIAHAMASLPSVAGRCTTVPYQRPDETASRPTAPPT